MEKLDNLTSYVINSLKVRNIETESVLLVAKSDLSQSSKFMEVWVIVTVDSLLIIEGIPKNTSTSRLFKKVEKVNDVDSWDERSFKRYDINDISDISTEVLTSSGMLTAKKNDSFFVICHYSNTHSRKFGLFSKLFAKIKDGNKITDEDIVNEDMNRTCPRCGSIYPEPAIKICSKCVNHKKIFARLMTYAKNYRKYIIMLLFYISVSSVFSIFVPWLTGSIYFNEVVIKGGKYYNMVWQLMLILIVLRVMSILVTILYGRINSYLAVEIVYDLRTDVFKSMQNLSMSFFTNKQTGTLMTRVNEDANNVQWFFHDGMPYIIINAINIVGVAVFMFTINPLLTAVVLMPAPFVYIFFKTYLPKFYSLYGKYHRKSAKMNSRMNDSFAGLRVVKAFGKEKIETTAFSQASYGFSLVGQNIGTTASTVFPTVGLIMWLGSLTIYIFGGLQVIKGNMLFGDITTMVGYAGMIYGPLQWFANLMQYWAGAMNSANRIFEIVDAVPTVNEINNPVIIENYEGHIVLKDVSFSYEPNKPVLNKINLDVKPGEVIGIVGHSGAGKSTLINLITRLYDVEEGSIFIDGHNIKDLSLKDLKNNIGIVLQDTFLFIGSVGENIAYGKPEASMEEIIAAAKAAYAHDFIMKLPDGYDTMIGVSGHGLSGGERQRLAIARAILKNPKILILDEATSSVDTQTESQIQQALSKLSKCKTTFNIAHRLSTLRDADRLIVLENGKIVEAGTHDELFNLKGVYHKLYAIQKEALKIKGISNND